LVPKGRGEEPLLLTLSLKTVPALATTTQEGEREGGMEVSARAISVSNTWRAFFPSVSVCVWVHAFLESEKGRWSVNLLSRALTVYLVSVSCRTFQLLQERVTYFCRSSSHS
jgi:hypothetical protein